MRRLRKLRGLFTSLRVVNRDGSSNRRAPTRRLSHGASMTDVFEDRVERLLGL